MQRDVTKSQLPKEKSNAVKGIKASSISTQEPLWFSLYEGAVSLVKVGSGRGSGNPARWMTQPGLDAQQAYACTSPLMPA